MHISFSDVISILALLIAAGTPGPRTALTSWRNVRASPVSQWTSLRWSGGQIGFRLRSRLRTERPTDL